MEKTTKKIDENKIKENIKEILQNQYTEEIQAKIGTNRDQKFVRIPKRVIQRMNAQNKTKLLFRMYTKDKKQHLEVEFK